jgi:hypothetical protein
MLAKHETATRVEAERLERHALDEAAQRCGEH